MLSPGGFLEGTDMSAHTMKLVTVVCEALARTAVTKLLREVGAHGYTLSQVEGVGSKGERTAEIAELANIKVEVIVPTAVCSHLLERLQAEFFPRYAIIAYESDVRVVRSDKF
jgi:nitrogen regulatory protein PII